MKPLFASVTGSKLYGTNTPESDTDFKGIALPDVDQLIGLNNFEQQEYHNEHDDGPEKAEGTLWAFEKYIRLCLKGNPTVIEVAFTDPKFHRFTTPLGLEIMEFVQKNMLTKHLFKPYSAYHFAQMRKLQSKQREGKRKAVVEEHGFDPKFAMHAYRLARQAVIVMREGTLRPTLDPEDKEVAMRIRAGKEHFTQETVLELLLKVDVEMKEAYDVSPLPDKPDFHAANDFVMDVHLRYLKGEFDAQFTQEFSLDDI